MNQSDSLSHLIAAARRRFAGNLVLTQGAWCVTAFFAAFSCLLLLGTQVVHWVWPAVLGLAAGIFGWFRVNRRIPTLYDTAQTLDHRLGSHDLFSTAFHFSTVPEDSRPRSRYYEPLAQEAQRAAQAAHAREAVPVRWPREAWIALGLMGLSVGLLALRYGVLHTLDLKTALVDLQFDTFTGTPEGPTQKKGGKNRAEELPPLTTLTVEDPPLAPEKDDTVAPENALETVDVPDVNQAGMPDGDKKRQSMTEGEQGGEKGETGDKTEPGDGKGQDDKGANPPPDRPSDGKKSGNQAPKEANNLLDKMRDAFNNMMDKMNAQPKGQESEQSGGQSKQQNAKGEKGGERGQQASAKSKGDPNSQQDSDQPGEPSDDASGNNKSQGDRLEEASNEPRSGMGKQDGKKDTELADQLDAMGKISEILGKRSANVSGEMMVEVQNSKQQLKTPHMIRTASHGEAGGEINRDEIPMHLQQYVQQYYEQVRKQPKTAAKQP